MDRADGSWELWAFVLEPLDDRSTRLIVRARGRAGAVARRIIPVVHFITQRKQLLAIAERAEMLNAPPVAC
jgi:hypothetical protein